MQHHMNTEYNRAYLRQSIRELDTEELIIERVIPPAAILEIYCRKYLLLTEIVIIWFWKSILCTSFLTKNVTLLPVMPSVTPPKW